MVALRFGRGLEGCVVEMGRRVGVGSKNVRSQGLSEIHAFVGAIDTDVRVELKEDAGLQKITPTVEAPPP